MVKLTVLEMAVRGTWVLALAILSVATAEPSFEEFSTSLQARYGAGFDTKEAGHLYKLKELHADLRTAEEAVGAKKTVEALQVVPPAFVYGDPWPFLQVDGWMAPKVAEEILQLRAEALVTRFVSTPREPWAVTLLEALGEKDNPDPSQALRRYAHRLGRAFGEKSTIDTVVEFAKANALQVAKEEGDTIEKFSLGALLAAAGVGAATAAYALATPVTVPMTGAFGLWAAMGYTTTVTPIASMTSSAVASAVGAAALKATAAAGPGLLAGSVAGAMADRLPTHLTNLVKLSTARTKNILMGQNETAVVLSIAHADASAPNSPLSLLDELKMLDKDNSGAVGLSELATGGDAKCTEEL